MNDFIQPGINITFNAKHDWHHFANLSREHIRDRWHTPTGQGLLNALKAERFSRQCLEANIGKFSDKYDLRGIPLSGERLAKLDLSDIDFFLLRFVQYGFQRG